MDGSIDSLVGGWVSSMMNEGAGEAALVPATATPEQSTKTYQVPGRSVSVFQFEGTSQGSG